MHVMFHCFIIVIAYTNIAIWLHKMTRSICFAYVTFVYYIVNLLDEHVLHEVKNKLYAYGNESDEGRKITG